MTKFEGVSAINLTIAILLSDVTASSEVLVQALSPAKLYCDVSNLDTGSSATVRWIRKSDGEEFKVLFRSL